MLFVSNFISEDWFSILIVLMNWEMPEIISNGITGNRINTNPEHYNQEGKVK